MKFLSKIYDFMFAPAGTYDAESGLFDATNDEHFAAADTVDHNVDVHSVPELIINPATNLPMTDGIGSIDVAGSPFGIDVHQNFDTTQYGSFEPISTCENVFDYGFSTFDSSSCADYGQSFDSSSMFD